MSASNPTASATVHIGARVTIGERRGLTALVAKQRSAMLEAGLGGEVNDSTLLRALIRGACAAAGIDIAGAPGPVSTDTAAPRRRRKGRGA